MSSFKILNKTLPKSTNATKLAEEIVGFVEEIRRERRRGGEDSRSKRYIIAQAQQACWVAEALVKAPTGYRSANRFSALDRNKAFVLLRQELKKLGLPNQDISWSNSAALLGVMYRREWSKDPHYPEEVRQMMGDLLVEAKAFMETVDVFREAQVSISHNTKARLDILSKVEVLTRDIDRAGVPRPEDLIEICELLAERIPPFT